MKPTDAAIKIHDPKNGLYGDCHRACLASILEMPISEVPHFMDKCDGRTTEESLAIQDEWLSGLGFSYVELPFSAPTLSDALDFIGKYSGQGHWMMIAESRSGLAHCVVCQGNKIVHDPTYGSPHGIVGPAKDEDTGESWYWAFWITVK